MARFNVFPLRVFLPLDAKKIAEPEISPVGKVRFFQKLRSPIFAKNPEKVASKSCVFLQWFCCPLQRFNVPQRHAMFSATALFDSSKLIIFAELTSALAYFKIPKPG